MFELNFNNLYNTFAERAAAAKSALRATTFGRGGVISVEENGGRVTFRIPLLNREFDNLGTAIGEASDLGVSEFFSFKSGTDPYRYGGQTNAAASIFDSIEKKVQRLSSKERQLLIDAGIDVNDLDKLTMDFATVKGKSGASAVVQKLKNLRERGILDPITMMDDDGARIIQFRANDTILTSYQSNLLLSVTGHNPMNPLTFGQILRSGNVENFADKLGKLSKRGRRILAAREISLAGPQLDDLLTVFKQLPNSSWIQMGGQTFEQSILALDPQYELLKIFASDTDVEDITELSDGAKAFYKGKSIEGYIGNLIKAAKGNKNLGDKAINELKAAINSFDGSTDTMWKSDGLKNHLKKTFATDDTRKILVDNLFSTIERGFDGSDLLNGSFLQKYRKSLKRELRDLNENVKTMPPGADRELARARIREIENSISNISDFAGLQQITGSGNVPGIGEIKTAFETIFFRDPRLRRYSAIISKFGFKTESSIAGDVPQFILSGLGHGSDNVFIDPVLAAFHNDVFASDEVIQGMQRRSLETLKELDEVIQADVLPGSIVDQLKRASVRDIDSLPVDMRQSATRSKEFARALLDLHQRGVSIKTSPQMMNMLHSFFAIQAFREKDGFIQGVLPNTYRFAIDTEASLLEPGKLGSGYKSVKSAISSTGTRVAINQDLLKFRVVGHKMYFAPQMVGEFNQALGGFDLDDKGLPMMRSFVDGGGKTRLGFYVYRQPSGVDESLFALAEFDNDTIKALFDNKYFKRTLNDLLKADAPEESLKTLKKIIQGKTKDINANPDDMEQAIIKVYKEMEDRKITTLARMTTSELRNLQRYGSSALRVDPATAFNGGFTLDDYVPTPTTENMFKVFTQSGAFDMLDETREVLGEVPMSDALRTQLTDAVNRVVDPADPTRVGDFSEVIRILGGTDVDGFESNNEAQAVLGEIFQRATRNKAQNQGILGLYVNRSMAAGSTLRQFEDMYQGLKDNEVKTFIKNNYNLGFLSQEEAIDLSINFSGTRKLFQEKIRQIENRSGVDPTRLARAINSITVKAGGEVTLDTLGEDLITNMGKVMGFTRGVEGFGKNAQISLDRFLLQSRLNKQDSKRLAEGILQGLLDARNGNFNVKADLDQQIERLTKLLEKPNNEAIQKYLMENIAIGPDNKYANMSKLQRIGKMMKGYFESTKKMNLRSISQDQALLSAKTTDQARSVAQEILDMNARLFQQLDTFMDVDPADMSEVDKATKRAITNKLGSDLSKQIDEAVSIQGITPEDLVNALDQKTSGIMTRDIGALIQTYEDEPTDEASRVMRFFNDARAMRAVRANEPYDQTVAEQMRKFFAPSSSGSPLTVEAMREEASEILAELTKNERGTLKEAILQNLSGNAGQIQDDTMRIEAQRQSAILEAMVTREGMGNRVADLEQMGTLNATSIPAGSDPDLVRLINSAAGTNQGNLTPNRAKYKRLSIDGIKNFFNSDDLVKKSTLGIAALAIGSIAYSAVRDRTADDITGPPLLPGGNPYEEGYPSVEPEVNPFSPGGYSSGMSYQINLDGASREQIDKFNAQASGFVNGNVSTTMYKRIPNVTRDPYVTMGQSY